MRIQYGRDDKIHRRFTPEWVNSGKVNIDKELPKYINALIAQKEAMVEYIEELHDEIDMLNGRLRTVIKSQENKQS